jgi:predicted ribosome-associated RNA-binding protein Tma20
MNFEDWLKQYGNFNVPKLTQIGRSQFTNVEHTLLSKQPVYSGELIGFQKKDSWAPSVDFLQKMAKNSKRHVVVDDKGEWMTICGRDLFGTSIVSHNNPGMGDFVVILNKHKEAIGLGKIVSEMTGKNVVVQRLYDIGDLLRRTIRKPRNVFK